MASLVKQSKKNPFIRQFVTSLVQPLQGKDWIAEISTCFEWIRNNIRYVQDIDGVETLQIPIATLQLQHGDCDDMCILLASFLATIGIRTRFVAVGFAPGAYEHVYVEILVPDTSYWLPADPTEPNPLGWAVPGVQARMVVEN